MRNGINIYNPTNQIFLLRLMSHTQYSYSINGHAQGVIGLVGLCSRLALHERKGGKMVGSEHNCQTDYQRCVIESIQGNRYVYESLD